MEGCVIRHAFLLLKRSDIIVKMKCSTLNALLIWQQLEKDFECSYNYSLPPINGNKCYEQWRLSLVLVKKKKDINVDTDNEMTWKKDCKFWPLEITLKLCLMLHC